MPPREQIERYDPASFEPRWAEIWESTGAHKADEDPAKPKWYSLEFFPYPSGDLHVGHAENYAIGDAIARYRRLRGYNVLHPMGFDAFGLPAENAAIERGVNPREWTYSNIAKHTATFKRFGSSLDWSRTLNSCDVDYYRWNQWFFIKFYERGLAYRKESPVNWCPSCKTVVANEQVEGGIHERCGTPVTKRNLPQWFFRITDYAERLLEDMEQLTGWSDRIVAMQRNWIGRSEGARVTFAIAETGEHLEVFTTRPDTLWGATYFVLAPEHPMARALAERTGKVSEFDDYLETVHRETEIERTALGRKKKGFNTGAHAVNPVNGEHIPVWVADYVLMEYGTGAIMAVPAHDQRDFEFARQEGIPIRIVIQPADAPAVELMTEPILHDGVMVNSGPFDGTPADRSVEAVIAWLEEQGLGTRTINYKMRDWGFSRQRYWGTPIPIIHCTQCGIVPVPEQDLPVVLPDIDDYYPAETGESPLAKATDWVNVSCPQCGGDARRETDTMDGFVDSSWYFLRFASPEPDRAFDPDIVARWLPVDQYTGGAEHAVMHLLYARFWTKVLFDMGLVKFTEPFPNLLNQGMVLIGGGKMAKSRPDLIFALKDAIERFGADALRVSELFAGPVEDTIDWESVSVEGNKKWLARVWRIVLENAERIRRAGPASGDSTLRRITHQKIQAIGEHYERMAFNLAVARMHELTNALSEMAGTSSDDDVREAAGALLIMLSPIAPFMTEELWQRLGATDSIHRVAWPAFDEALTRVDTVTMVVTVNGKVRDRIEVPASIGEEDMRARALDSAKVRAHTEGKEVAKTIIVPPKIVNIVVR